MNGSSQLPSLEVIKKQARQLRGELEAKGNSVNHSQALELLAHQHGFKDWNTLFASIGNGPPPCPVTIGQQVSGHYLGQSFEAEILGVQVFAQTGRFRITLHFDEPVDVVTFDSFSSFRQRVSATITATGETLEKTSDGQPQLKLAL